MFGHKSDRNRPQKEDFFDDEINNEMSMIKPNRSKDERNDAVIWLDKNKWNIIVTSISLIMLLRYVL